MPEQFRPLVSIVIPVYNGSNYLREAVDSALAQTYPDVEILVVDDGSDDGGATHEIAASYGDRIRYFHKDNGGVVSALNFGIEHMRGEYFAWLSHDDLYHPKKIERQVSALAKHDGGRPAFCICNCTFIDEKGNELSRSYVREDCDFSDPACYLFLGNVGLNGLMVLIPKILFDRCGLFKPSLATHEYDMWLRIMAAADVVVEPECLTYMRVHPQQMSSLKKQKAMQEIDEFMGAGIRDIPDDVFRSYAKRQFDRRGIGYLFDLLNSYIWYQPLPRSAFHALEHICRLFGSPSEIADFFFSQMFGPPALDTVWKTAAQLRDGGKALIVIYCENASAEAFAELVMGLAVASASCEIVLLYHEMNEERLKSLRNIPLNAFRVLAANDAYLPLYISLLCRVWNAKLFWGVQSGGRLRFETSFYFLKFMEIGVMATILHTDATLAAPQAVDIQGVNQGNRLLPEPLLTTTRQSPQVLGAYGLRNVIVIPEDPLEALGRWKRIFAVLLGVYPYRKLEREISVRLTDILENTQISLAEYVKRYVISCIAQIEQQNTATIRYYEQRTFWKITKPLRFGVWFLRKAGKAVKRVLRKEETLGEMISRIPNALKNRRTSV